MVPTKAKKEKDRVKSIFLGYCEKPDCKSCPFPQCSKENVEKYKAAAKERRQKTNE